MKATQNSALPAISIAMATYNGERFLAEQLESLRSQTTPPLELIITDDRSIDSTPDVIRRFAENVDFPVRFSVNPERLGYADNFFRAASLCTGPLIAFCDQDDRWLPEKLARCAAAMTDPDVQLCLHEAKVWDGDQTSHALYPDIRSTGVFTPPTLDPFKLVPGFAMVVRRELLDIAPSTQRLRHMLNAATADGTSIAHDDFCWLLAVTTGKVALIKEVLAFYRQHASNALGAPEAETAGTNLVLALSDVQYGAMAHLEAEYADFVAGLTSKLPIDRQIWVRQSAEGLRFRAACHQTRAEIYESHNQLLARLKSFLRLIRSGAYRDTSSHNTLGKRAFLKDLVYGVTGMYQSRGAAR